MGVDCWKVKDIVFVLPVRQSFDKYDSHFVIAFFFFYYSQFLSFLLGIFLSRWPNAPKIPLGRPSLVVGFGVKEK